MSQSRPAAVIILAAGEGKRMKSRTPKVLHSLCGRSMLGHALAAAEDLAPERLVVVTGHGRDQVGPEVASLAPDATVVVQEQQLGTGHAVRMVTEAIGAIPGVVVVTYADMPLLRGETLRELVRAHQADGSAVTVLTAMADEPAGYGRIVRDAAGSLARIVEDRDATPGELAIQEINSGCYAFDGALLIDAIKRVTTDNAQGQEYLTDVVAILRADGYPIGTVLAADSREIQGVNDRVQLASARRILNDRLLTDHMLNGVTIFDPASTWVDITVTIGQDTEILPNTQLLGGDHDRRGREDRPQRPPRGHCRRRRRRATQHREPPGEHWRRRDTGAERLPQARDRHRGQCPHRVPRGAEEVDGRRRGEGSSSHLRRRRDHRRRVQHWRGHDLRQLRWR